MDAILTKYTILNYWCHMAGIPNTIRRIIADYIFGDCNVSESDEFDVFQLDWGDIADLIVDFENLMPGNWVLSCDCGSGCNPGCNIE